ncbi:hypothetical protein GCM10010517_52410 [Streptosporangium fragile]|uniref:Alpha-xylosidase n=1 Tax=Streptosporangium fragile TaxID=46186 RepID=A0ABN3W3F3_9ACTN
MKFTDGFWQLRPGVTALYAAEAYDICAEEDAFTVTAPTTVINRRGDTLNRPVLSLLPSSPLVNVIRVRIDHHTGGGAERGFDLVGAEDGHGVVKADDADGATLTSGALSATMAPGAPWNLSFHGDGRPLTSSGHKSIGYFAPRHAPSPRCRSTCVKAPSCPSEPGTTGRTTTTSTA